VSFDELRSLGIENPAVLCYELDLIGVPIARVNRYVAGRAVPVGVRIDESVPADYALEPKPPRWQLRLRRPPSEESQPTTTRPQPMSSALHLMRRRASEVGRLARAQLESARAKSAHVAGAEDATLASAKGARLASAKGASVARAKGATLAGAKGASVAREKGASLARAARPIVTSAGRHKGRTGVIAMAVVAVAVITIVLADQPGGGTSSGVARAGAVRHPGGPRVASHRATSRYTPAPSPSAPPGEPSQLEAEGHQLLGEERYRAAAADLIAAVGRSGESTARCLEPNTVACLTYAYALFDLGRALRLEGDRSGAVEALSERLRINDQRGAVQEELSKAREGGGTSAPASK
jgi:hypothetical protein